VAEDSANDPGCPNRHVPVMKRKRKEHPIRRRNSFAIFKYKPRLLTSRPYKGLNKGQYFGLKIPFLKLVPILGVMVLGVQS
jgi:hypothetical protein